MKKAWGKCKKEYFLTLSIRKVQKEIFFHIFQKDLWEKRALAGENTDRYRTFWKTPNEGKISLKIYFPLQAQGDLSKLTTHPLAQALPETR